MFHPRAACRRLVDLLQYGVTARFGRRVLKLSSDTPQSSLRVRAASFKVYTTCRPHHTVKVLNSTHAYDIHPIHPVGAEVRNISLKDDDIQTSTVESIAQILTKHRILIFKEQGVVPPERQVAITEWFGEVDDVGFEQHPKSPRREILRASNSAKEGFQDFGTTGFHIDGSFMKCPNAVAIYHIIDNPTRGSTVFVPLNEVFEGAPPEMRARWERLWLLKTFHNSRGHTFHQGDVVHPLVYEHPATGLKTLCIHQGKTSRFIWDKGLPSQRVASKEETAHIVDEIGEELSRDHCSLHYVHQWEAGDFIISDNLALAHRASAETQLPVEEVGLRVMHRTLVKGTHRPWNRLVPRED